MTLEPRCEAHSDPGAGHGNGCKISMLLNSNTIDSCFLSPKWKITTNAMFAGTCIGVFAFAIFLEFLRRAVREWDKYITRRHAAAYRKRHRPEPSGGLFSSVPWDPSDRPADEKADALVAAPPFRPNVWEQIVRSVLHTAQFTMAYFIMLLAMYFNIYILISIFLGILVGNCIFGPDLLPGETIAKGGASEPTVCCG